MNWNAVNHAWSWFFFRDARSARYKLRTASTNATLFLNCALLILSFAAGISALLVSDLLVGFEFLSFWMFWIVCSSFRIASGIIIWTAREPLALKVYQAAKLVWLLSDCVLSFFLRSFLAHFVIYLPSSAETHAASACGGHLGQGVRLQGPQRFQAGCGGVCAVADGDTGPLRVARHQPRTLVRWNPQQGPNQTTWQTVAKHKTTQNDLHTKWTTTTKKHFTRNKHRSTQQKTSKQCACPGPRREGP